MGGIFICPISLLYSVLLHPAVPGLRLGHEIILDSTRTASTVFQLTVSSPSFRNPCFAVVFLPYIRNRQCSATVKTNPTCSLKHTFPRPRSIKVFVASMDLLI